MSRHVGILQVCGAIALTALVALPARAEPAVEVEQALPTVVLVSLDSSLAGISSVDGLAAQLAELSARIVTAPASDNLTLAHQALRAIELARQQQALGTLWLRQEDDRKLRVYVYDAKHRQLASRTLTGPAAAVREEVAVVLRSAISSLIAGEATALEPVAIPPPVPALPAPPVPASAPPPAAPPAPRYPRLGLGPAYAGTTYASGAFQHGFELRLNAELTSRVLLGLNGTWFQVVRMAGGGAEAVLDRYPLELAAGYAFASVRGFRCYAMTGLVLERVTRSTRIADARLRALPDENRYRLAVAAALLAELELGSRLLGLAAFGAEVATDRYDYVVQSAGGPIRLAPRSVRPRLEVGVVVRLW